MCVVARRDFHLREPSARAPRPVEHMRVYAPWLPDSSQAHLVDWLDDASRNATNATSGAGRARSNRAKSFRSSGEPGGNRTHNPQIKRTTGGRPSSSNPCFRSGNPPTSLLIRPRVSTCDRPLVCQIVCHVSAASTRRCVE